MKFIDLGLSKKTVQAIHEFGMDEATTVQCDVIPSILDGKDIFTIAPARCGKTMSYVLPLIDIISNKAKQNILIITPNSEQSVFVSDRLSIFNKYHEIDEKNEANDEENIDSEANVVIGSPDLLIDLVENSKFDFSKTNILVVDDINLIKKNKQLDNLEKILALLPADKQNIVYTNRRSKETQSILQKILKAPQEIKIDKAKEEEINTVPTQKTSEKKDIVAQDTKKMNRDKNSSADKNKSCALRSSPKKDKEAVDLAKKYKSFNNKVPEFILNKGILADDKEYSECALREQKISSLY